ncbi:toprim domain-containing protein [Vibrio cyclitrophicus]|uniref:toprim domain-containing protein n=1 Tax=Vibrio cyclitrophicus TaxID=47951 RepID=UPI0032E4669C
MKRDFEAEKVQFYDEIERYGWLRILEEATPLDNAIQYVGTKNSNRFDICPSHACSEHQLWSKSKTGKATGNFELFPDANVTGAGYCHKCKTRFSRFDIIMEFQGWTFSDAAKEVKHIIGFKPDPNYRPKPKVHKPVATGPKEPTQSDLRDAKRLKKKMNDVWEQAVFLNNEIALPAARYFASRGITNLHAAMKNEVKYHPQMPFYIPISHPSEDRKPEDANERLDLIDYCQTHPSFDCFYEKTIDGVNAPTMANMGLHPCLLIMVRTKYGEPRRLHRIFLDENGDKASFSQAGFEVKKMMPGGYGLDITGCSCYIDNVSKVVGVGEGFETVLAVKQATEMPMDCAINAGGIKNYQPRDGVTHVFIFEDKDASMTGENVSLECEERLVKEGYYVLRVPPPIELGDRKSIDWLDVLNEIGVSGFPEAAMRWRELL